MTRCHNTKEQVLFQEAVTFQITLYMSISLQEGNCAAAGSSHSFTTSHFYGQYVNQKIAVCYYDAVKEGVFL